MIELKNLKINYPVLAPMAGFTDSAFRQICIKCGAGLTVSEMISAKALYFGDKKTKELISFSDKERPFALQLFGSEPESMKIAAQMLEEYKPDVIDINMGCPVPKIAGNGCGSALLKDMRLAGKIVNEVVKSVKIPISVKIRIGWDSEHICAAEFAKVLEENGASFITVHGRTREQMYKPGINTREIANVKKAVKIPVIANGDVTDACSMKKMLKETGCDLVMIGRGALGNPFIFSELKAVLDGEDYSAPSFDDRMKLLTELCRLECENKGEKLAMLELRRHLPFFFKGCRGAAALRKKCGEISSLEQLSVLLDEIRKTYTEEPINEI